VLPFAWATITAIDVYNVTFTAPSGSPKVNEEYWVNSRGSINVTGNVGDVVVVDGEHKYHYYNSGNSTWVHISTTPLSNSVTLTGNGQQVVYSTFTHKISHDTAGNYNCIATHNAHPQGASTPSDSGSATTTWQVVP
jgi:hypothetical protein